MSAIADTYVVAAIVDLTTALVDVPDDAFGGDGFLSRVEFMSEAGAAFAAALRAVPDDATAAAAIDHLGDDPYWRDALEAFVACVASEIKTGTTPTAAGLAQIAADVLALLRDEEGRPR